MNYCFSDIQLIKALCCFLINCFECTWSNLQHVSTGKSYVMPFYYYFFYPSCISKLPFWRTKKWGGLPLLKAVRQSLTIIDVAKYMQIKCMKKEVQSSTFIGLLIDWFTRVIIKMGYLGQKQRNSNKRTTILKQAKELLSQRFNKLRVK